MSALRTLHVEDLTQPLPTPSAHPALTELSVSLSLGHPDVQAICSSVGAYLPQLTTLKLNLGRHSGGRSAAWAAILNASTTSHTLKHLTTNESLDDELLPLLLQHTPNLQYLSVGRVNISSERHADAHWQVEVLENTDRYGAMQLVGLPQQADASRPLRVRLGDRGALEVVVTHDGQGVSEPVRRRLAAGVVFEGLTRIGIGGIKSHLNDWDTALRATLHHVGHVQSDRPWHCVLHDSEPTPELLDMLAEVKAALPQLSAIDLRVYCLDDKITDMLLDHPGCVRAVVTHFLTVREDFSKCEWDYAEVQVDEMDEILITLTRMPMAPEGKRTRIRINRLNVGLQAHEVLEDDGAIQALVDRLHMFDLQPAEVVVDCNFFDAEHMAAVLRADLELVTHLERANPASMIEGRPTWELCGWQMNEEVVAALIAGLPNTPRGSVFFDNCDWSEDLSHEACLRLGAALATTFADYGWRFFMYCHPEISVFPAKPEVMVAMFQGASSVLKGSGKQVKIGLDGSDEYKAAVRDAINKLELNDYIALKA